MKQTWYYAIIFHKKDFPFTTHLSLNKSEIKNHCDYFWKNCHELRSIEIEKP